MLRKRISVLMFSVAIIAGGLVVGAPVANAANTAPTSATYGASAAVDVQRTPGYPTCTPGTPNTYNSFAVRSTGNPISQSAFNDTLNYTTSRVNLSDVPYYNGTTTVTTAAELKVVIVDNTVTPNTFGLQMFIAGGGAELKWDTDNNRWNNQGTGNSFSITGYVYALYSGGFLHEGFNTRTPPDDDYNIGTFLMIDSTLPTGSTLTYTASPGATDNICNNSIASSYRTYATSDGMASTNLGGSGTIVTPSGGGGIATAPMIPMISISIGANGGTCNVSQITGVQGTWSTVPTERECIRPGYVLAEFNTQVDGSGLSFLPGGNILLNYEYPLYAIYGEPRTAGAPSEVLATVGVDEVNISWLAPADPGSSLISNYLVQANPSGRVCVTSVSRDSNPLSCTMTLPATNTKYTFDVQALNSAGWGQKSSASNAVSPYNLILGDVSRTQDRILFVKTGSTLNVKGRAPGVAQGTVVTPQIKIGSGQWVTETRNLPKVGRDQSITWSKKLKKSVNNQPVQVRMAVLGASAESTPVKVGARAGVPTAPRNVTVTFTEARIPSQRKVQVSWEASANDGGSAITFYEVSLRVLENSLPATCRVPANKQLTCTLSTGVLEQKKKYTVNVTATNASGQSNPAKADFRRP